MLVFSDFVVIDLKFFECYKKLFAWEDLEIFELRG